MKKKQTIITAIAVVLAFIVGYFVGDSSTINRVNKQVDASVIGKQNKTEEKKETKQEQKEETKIYKLSEGGVSGNWNIKVLEAKETSTIQAGNSSDNKTTKEKFIVVKLQMKNISKQPVQYSPNEFILGNMKDKSQYNTNMDVGMVANQKETIYNKNDEFVGVYTDVNPNTPKQTYVVFEVPKEIKLQDTVLINTNNNSEPTGFYLK